MTTPLIFGFRFVSCFQLLFLPPQEEGKTLLVPLHPKSSSKVCRGGYWNSLLLSVFLLDLSLDLLLASLNLEKLLMPEHYFSYYVLPTYLFIFLVGLRKCRGSRWLSHDRDWLLSIEYIVEGSLNSKLPTIWRVEKQR